MLKKSISILLSAILAFSCMNVLSFAQDSCTCQNPPIVYVKGRFDIYKDVTVENPVLAERNTSGENAIADASKNMLIALGKSMLTDNWNYYSDVLYNEVVEMYDGYALNDDGEVDNNSGVEPKYNQENLIKSVREQGKNKHITYCNSYSYDFHYDCRIDPCVNAGYLNDYIECIKEVSGHNKVYLVTRCFGTVITNAYLNMYGYDSIEKIIFYNSIANGAEIADSAFSGNIALDSVALNRFCNEFLGSSAIYDLIKSTVNLATATKTLDLGVDFCNDVYEKVLPILVPKLIKGIFGKCPGWYGTISYDRFEECKNFVLGDNADGKYNKLIEKIDNYNYNYKCKTIQTLSDAQNAGVYVYIIAKYNDQFFPIVENNNTLGDNVVSTYKQTYCGATCAENEKTLSQNYLDTTNPKYVSADKIIDSSTCPLPDHTWFIRDLRHDWYPDVVTKMIVSIFRDNSYATIDTFSEYPQYLQFEGVDKNDANSKLIPITEENASTEGSWPNTSKLPALLNWVSAIMKLLLTLGNL